jgi:Fe-S oxidoreductase
MCRHANPTFLVTKLDAHTPRGYALGLSRIDDGLASWDADLASKLFASTLDGLCSELCEFDWREDLVVQAGRAEAVRAGVAPDSVRRAAQRRSEGDGTAFPAAPIAADRLDREGAEILFLTGLDARARAPETISATGAILDHLGCDWTAMSVEPDAGIDLWELGYDESATRAAERFSAAIARLGPTRIVTGSSRVARALREPLPAEISVAAEVEHLSEFLASRVSAPEDTGASTEVVFGTIAYHDPCALGRRLGVYDEPRAVIGKIAGAAPVEFFHCRAIAECCGDGGLLPEIDPGLASRLADAQLARLPEGVDTLVTACPGCKAQLAGAAHAAGHRVVVTDLSELVADRLGLS